MGLLLSLSVLGVGERRGRRNGSRNKIGSEGSTKVEIIEAWREGGGKPRRKILGASLRRG